MSDIRLNPNLTPESTENVLARMSQEMRPQVQAPPPPPPVQRSAMVAPPMPTTMTPR